MASMAFTAKTPGFPAAGDTRDRPGRAVVRRIRHSDHPPVGIAVADLRSPSARTPPASEETVRKDEKAPAGGAPISEVLRDTIHRRRLTAYAAARSSGVSVDAV